MEHVSSRKKILKMISGIVNFFEIEMSFIKYNGNDIHLCNNLYYDKENNHLADKSILYDVEKGVELAKLFISLIYKDDFFKNTVSVEHISYSNVDTPSDLVVTTSFMNVLELCGIDTEEDKIFQENHNGKWVVLYKNISLYKDSCN